MIFYNGEFTVKKSLTVAACVLLLPAIGWAGKAHEHGAAKLNVSLEGQQLTIALESPLDGIVGFERAPKNAAEKAKVDAAVAQLQAAEKLFKIEPSFGLNSGLEIRTGVLPGISGSLRSLGSSMLFTTKIRYADVRTAIPVVPLKLVNILHWMTFTSLASCNQT